MKIENILNHKFKTEEELTLELLESLNIFNYGNELMEVSAQASSEAALELLLKKVHDQNVFFSLIYWEFVKGGRSVEGIGVHRVAIPRHQRCLYIGALGRRADSFG